jgi:adhesin transport system membrane fusion protein
MSRGDGGSRVVLWASLLSLGVAVGWAAVSEIDQVTRATGKVIASSRSQVVQAVEGGVLETLNAREGDAVQQGQLLAVLDKTRLNAQFQESRAKAVALGAQVARLKAEVYGTPLQLSADLRDYPDIAAAQTALLRKRLGALAEDLAALERSADLVRRELALNEPLLATGDVSEVDVIRLRRQLSDLQAQMTSRRNKQFQDAQAELARAEDELASVRQNVAQREDALSRTELRAPLAGTVKNVRVTTLGAVLKSGEELLQIVPAGDDLLVEVRIRPQDIAHLKPGLPAQVKIDAYDYTIYGMLDGTLSYISPDTLEEGLRANEQPYYRGLVTTRGLQFRKRPQEALEIQPGMTASVDIVTGRNTVLRYLTKPLIKTVDGAMGER